MKKVFLLLIVISLLQSCDSPNALDCFQAEGNQVTEIIELAPFDEIIFGDGIRMVLKQGDEQSVRVETGVNLLPEISFDVTNQTLTIDDSNDCNFARDYGATTVFVTSPNIVKISNASRWEIRSDGVLSYPNLTLWSVTTPVLALKSGDFYLELATENLKVWANGVSVFYLSGTTVNADFSFSDEQPRMEAQNLEIMHLTVLHRSANDMIVRPKQSITGVIRGTGNIIAKNRPPIVEVLQIFTGRLIFDD